MRAKGGRPRVVGSSRSKEEEKEEDSDIDDDDGGDHGGGINGWIGIVRPLGRGDDGMIISSASLGACDEDEEQL